MNFINDYTESCQYPFPLALANGQNIALNRGALALFRKYSNRQKIILIKFRIIL
jgi:hypothetical protein